MVQDTKKHIKDLFDYLDIPYENQTNDFIDLSHSKHDKNNRSVFKNPKLSKPWIDMLDPSIVSACLAELDGTELEQFLKTLEL